jgi:hypothetical protein
VSESGFSEELDRFIAAEIQSLEQLEILLLLSGNPHKWWTAQGVYDVIKSSLSSVEARLGEMVAKAILLSEVEGDRRYRFSPNDDSVWRIVSELRDAYKERSVKVVQAIYNKPQKTEGITEFAKAFRLRKD